MGPLPKRRHSTRRGGSRNKGKGLLLKNLVKNADGSFRLSHREARGAKKTITK